MKNLARAALAVAAFATTGCVSDASDEADDDPVAEESQALVNGKVIVGIADSEANTFEGTAWRDLGADFVRAVIPWNVALLNEQTCETRKTFDAYLAAARTAKARVVLMFGPDVGGDPKACPAAGATRDRAPTPGQFRDAMDAFVREYPKLKILGAWNEPDYGDGPKVPDLGNTPLHRHPARAADYYVELRKACASCLLLAGELASNPANEDSYWEPYRNRIKARGVAEPKVWSIHPTRDLLLYAADASDALDGKRRGEGKRCFHDETRGCVTKTFATWVASLPGNATVWLTETEAPVARPTERHLTRSFDDRTQAQREKIQANAMRFLFDEVVKSHKNVTRVFIYPLRERPGKRNDSGLITADGKRRRESFGVVQRYIPGGK